MSGKLEKSRFADTRTQLKEDLELYLLLQRAQEDEVPELKTLVQIAYEAVQASAKAYAAAGAVLGFGPEASSSQGQSQEPSRPQAFGSARVPQGTDMSTEDLMKLFDDEGK